MKARKNGKHENSGVDSWQVIAGVVGDAGGKHDGGNSHDLNGGVDLTQPGGPEAAEAGHDIYRCRTHDNKYVPADDGHCDPERHRQVAGYGWRENAAHRKNDEGGDHHQLVGDWIEHRAQLRALIKSPGQQSIQSIGKAGAHKYRQRQNEPLIEEHGDENGNKHHPKDGEHIWNGKNSGGHRVSK